MKILKQQQQNLLHCDCMLITPFLCVPDDVPRETESNISVYVPYALTNLGYLFTECLSFCLGTRIVCKNSWRQAAEIHRETLASCLEALGRGDLFCTFQGARAASSCTAYACSKWPMSSQPSRMGASGHSSFSPWAKFILACDERKTTLQITRDIPMQECVRFLLSSLCFCICYLQPDTASEANNLALLVSIGKVQKYASYSRPCSLGLLPIRTPKPTHFCSTYSLLVALKNKQTSTFEFIVSIDIS